MNNLWEQMLDRVKAHVSQHTFNTWFKPIQFKSYNNDKVCVEVPNSYYKEKIQKEYSNTLLQHLRESAFNPNIQLVFTISDNSNTQQISKEISAEISKERDLKKDPQLNSKYTFESFVVGNNNQFAHAACEAVSKSPGKTYNPLFIYGGVGLGKTHLLSSIGNEVYKLNPRLKVVYRSSEQFTNDLINSLKFNKMESFRTQYRQSCDVLLLDDIHFLSGKERTQEEFFHTFNHLYQDGKQIVLTSDRMPSEIADLDERLRSRFQSGLFCDIQKPDIETRVAILKRKADQYHVQIDDDVLFVMAENVDSNIRVLEGCLTRMVASASLNKREINEELVKEVIFEITSSNKMISPEDIIKAVSSFFHLKSSDLKSSRKHKVVAQPRQIAMYLSREKTKLSFPELGEKFGGKDHTTIMHGHNKIKKELENNPQLRSTILAIEKNLQ